MEGETRTLGALGNQAAGFECETETQMKILAVGQQGQPQSVGAEMLQLTAWEGGLRSPVCWLLENSALGDAHTATSTSPKP